MDYTMVVKVTIPYPYQGGHRRVQVFSHFGKIKES
jgi:hypothetical protein